MRPAERRTLKQKAESFEEMLSLACKKEKGHGERLSTWVDEVESFLEDNGFNRATPRKAAVTYVLTRHGHSAVTVSKWWGEADSRYWALSADTAKKYMRQIKELINEHPDADADKNWTDGDKVYESNEDPLKEFFDVEVESKGMKISDFC